MPLPLKTRVSNWSHRVIALTALSLLAGCGVNSDFGEVRPTLVRDDIHDWVGPYAVNGKRTFPKIIDLNINTKPTFPSDFQLTDDERQLRDLAYPFIEPPYDRQQWYSVLGEYGLIELTNRKKFDHTIYAKRLLSSYHRSPSSSYSQLADDINSDNIRLPQFFETAARVLDVDEKRRKSMEFVPDLTKLERKKAVRRMHENARIVALVGMRLEQRVSSYQFALGRLVVRSPSDRAVDSEIALNDLRDAVAYYQSHTAPTWVREQSLAAAL